MGGFNLANLMGGGNMRAPQMPPQFGMPSPYIGPGQVQQPPMSPTGFGGGPGAPPAGGIGNPQAPMMPVHPGFGGPPVAPPGGIGDPRAPMPPVFGGGGRFGGFGAGAFGQGNPMMMLHQLNGLGMGGRPSLY